ncbi:aldehyde dehydrogenase family protein [Aquisalimonas lutea]|uniref:aldehyde dehydrogenase family protein n=1 Tax=Aquisalimonas lutea TaxID=1327750 RepID=UPI0025B618B1|nr:aldehyde dehydrogenase family protein [Aquisalimonas lutea]MDN3517546.1 aldehyde dehydrogenase family protein [Aquisalimonas lutea]
MADRYPNLIGGEKMDSQEATANINPSNTDDVIGEFAQASRQDVDAAATAAREAFPAWARTTPAERHGILQRASDELVSRKNELGTLLSREEGKTRPEGIAEVTRAGQVLSFFAGECLRLGGELIPSVRPGVSVEVTREPLGVVGVITPWNFPTAIPAWKIAPALACGNTVVFKPAELVPASAWALTEVLHRAGLPAGVLNLVMGQGSVVGSAMADHPDIAAITFTGSVATGQTVAAACVASRPMKKMQLEMGGKNPLVVLDDADLDTAVECAVNGSFFSTGQRCTASSRLIVTDGIYDTFIDALTRRLDGLTVDDALKEGTDIGPVVDQSQLQKDFEYIQIGQSEGATLHWGGQTIERTPPGHYLQPALFTDVNSRMRIAREEIFGPIAAVIRVANYAEALDIANDTQYGLTAGICTTSLKYASDFRRNAQSGLTMVNLPTAGLDYHVPFGGMKDSSYGPREQGRHAVEFYTSLKTSYVRPE